MCGITGIVNLNKNILNAENKNILYKMSNRISKRGPDEDGTFEYEHALLAHKRLIVIDPNGGKQPMSCVFNNNLYTIIYNGQLYNTDELRKELTDNGFTFDGHSDTEVLLKSYIHFGNDVVHKLNGIYGFAIWNNNKQELFMARDHFGVKPFFYCKLNDYFIFASEIKSILEFPRIKT